MRLNEGSGRLSPPDYFQYCVLDPLLPANYRGSADFDAVLHFVAIFGVMRQVVRHSSQGAYDTGK